MFLDFAKEPNILDFLETANTVVTQLVNQNILRGKLVEKYLKVEESLMYQQLLWYQSTPLNQLMGD